jgi:hypothetical protein
MNVLATAGSLLGQTLMAAATDPRSSHWISRATALLEHLPKICSIAESVRAS